MKRLGLSLHGLWIVWLGLATTLAWAAGAVPSRGIVEPPARVARTPAPDPLGVRAVRDEVPLVDGLLRAFGSPGSVTIEGLVFPVAGPHVLRRSFGDPRGGGTRSHAGEDIFAPKMTPVVAVADGVVSWVHEGARCCALAVEHADGWSSRYIHLNNDSLGTDDGKAHGIAPGLSVGTRVWAGQLLGWVGDSGNAEGTRPHLHFELRRHDGDPVDAFTELETASAEDRWVGDRQTS